MNGLFWFLIVGLIAGWLAGLLVKGGGFGVLGDILIGVSGAVIGGLLFGGIGTRGLLGSVFVATVGAVLLIIVGRLIKRT